MSVIWKFPLDAMEEQHVVMPRGARLLTVGVQDDGVVLWAECDDKGEYVGRKEPPVADTYIGTFTVDEPSMFGGRIVGHVYDGGEFTVEERLAA